MAYKVIILYQLYMPSYFLGTFTEYPLLKERQSDRLTLPLHRFIALSLLLTFLILNFFVPFPSKSMAKYTTNTTT